MSGRANVVERIAALVGHDVLRVTDAALGWPALAELMVDGAMAPVALFVAPVGLSHRGRDDVERRFQNPGSRRPIIDVPQRDLLLLGLWEKDPLVFVERPLLVSADPLRRLGRKTRFSVFVSMNLLHTALDEDWSEGKNALGEPIRCFVPSLLARSYAADRDNPAQGTFKLHSEADGPSAPPALRRAGRMLVDDASFLNVATPPAPERGDAYDEHVSSDFKVGGELVSVPLTRLIPDALNPRLPPAVQRQRLSEEELYPFLDRAYDVISIAESIVRHGFFVSEPLVAVSVAAAYPDEELDSETDGLVVVEGNRRLAALKALADPDLRKQLRSPRWARLPAQVELPDEIPVLVVDNRQKAAPILGFRHITRAAPWEPFPQARYIAGLIDDHGRSFKDVADLLDRGEPEVRSYYRNYWVFVQADEELNVEDCDRISESFGVFTRAMQNPEIRNYVGAPDPRDVDPDIWPLDEDHAEQFEQMVTWLFGAPRTEQREDARPPRPGQVLLDSREVTKLGRAVGDERSRRALEDGATLSEALEEVVDPYDALLRGCRAFRRVLKRAQSQLGDGDGEISTVLEKVEALERHYSERAVASPGT